jgi:hypothetical protein
MTKSEIVVAIFLSQTGNAKKEKDIRKELASSLKARSLTPDQWDQPVSDSIGHAIIKNMSVNNGKLSMEYVIKDVDTILKRIL